jgi:hypothetical protein
MFPHLVNEVLKNFKINLTLIQIRITNFQKASSYTIPSRGIRSNPQTQMIIPSLKTIQTRRSTNNSPQKQAVKQSLNRMRRVRELKMKKWKKHKITMKRLPRKGQKRVN